MRIFVVADQTSARALKERLEYAAPCAAGWRITSEPEIVIEDLSAGLDRPVAVSEDRWLVACNDPR